MCSCRSAGKFWMNPQDYGLARSPKEFSPLFGSYHPGLCQFVFGDGSVRPLQVTIDVSILTLLADRNDGQPIPGLLSKPPAAAEPVTRAALGQQPLHHVPVHVGQAEVAALEAVGQPRVVDAQQVQDAWRCRSWTWTGSCDDVVAEVVGLAVGDAAA